MLNHPTGLFLGDYNSALRGAGPSNFYTPYNSEKFISSRTWGAGRPHVGLCPIFIVKLKTTLTMSQILNLTALSAQTSWLFGFCHLDDGITRQRKQTFGSQFSIIF